MTMSVWTTTSRLWKLKLESEIGRIGWWFDTSALTPAQTAERILAEATKRAAVREQARSCQARFARTNSRASRRSYALSSVTIPLVVDGVSLRPLERSDAEAHHELLSRNHCHLRPHYAEDIAAPESEQAALFASNPDPSLMFGIFADEFLIGRIDLVALDPPHFGAGLLGQSRAHTRGHSQRSCRSHRYLCRPNAQRG
jgi:hypothetical protein